MKRFFSRRVFPAALLAVLTAVALLFAGKTGPAIFPGPENLAALGPEAAEAALLGLPRENILSAWGEPDGVLSGLFRDIYTLESGARIVVYYDTEPMSQGTADGQTVPVEHVLILETD